MRMMFESGIPRRLIVRYMASVLAMCYGCVRGLLEDIARVLADEALSDVVLEGTYSIIEPVS